MNPDGVLNAFVHMVAPYDAADDDTWAAKGAYAHKLNDQGEEVVDWDKALAGPENNMYAFNNCRMKCKVVDEGDLSESSDIMIRNDYTRVGILPTVVEVTKEWEDDDDHDGKRPEEITITLLRRRVLTDDEFAPVLDKDNQPYTAVLREGEWKHTFMQMDVQTVDGDRYEYTFREEVDGKQIEEAGYTGTTIKKNENTYVLINRHPKEQVELKGVKTWNDNDDENGARPSSVVLKLYCDGDLVKTLTVSPDASGAWSYDFGSMDKWKEGGKEEHVYTVEEEYVPKYGFTSTGYGNALNTYSPFGNLEVIKRLSGATPRAAEKEFTFTLTMISDVTKDPLANGYKCSLFTEQEDGSWKEEKDKAFTIHSGEQFTLKGNQKLLVKEIPSETVYSVVEEEKAGFTASKVGDTGAIQACRTQTAEFTNTYASEGSVELFALKKMDGHAIFRNQFHFELVDDTEDSPTRGQVISNGLNTTSTTEQKNGPGNPIFSYAPVGFGRITYTAADDGKVMHYRMREVPGNESGYTYDGTEKELWVRVTDQGDGTMSVEVFKDAALTEKANVGLQDGLDSSFVFSNEYKASGEVVLEAWKTLDGRALTDKEFTFELCEIAPGVDFATMDPADRKYVIDEKTCDTNGKVVFDKLSFTQNHVDWREDQNAQYRYGIREVRGGDSTVNYSTERYIVTLTVLDNNDGTLTILQDNQTGEREYKQCTTCEGRGLVKGKNQPDVELDWEKNIICGGNIKTIGRDLLKWDNIFTETTTWPWNSSKVRGLIRQTDVNMAWVDLCNTCRGTLEVDGQKCPVCGGSGLEVGGIFRYNDAEKHNGEATTYKIYRKLLPNGDGVTCMSLLGVGGYVVNKSYLLALEYPVAETCPDCKGTGIGNPGGMTVVGDAPHRVFTNTVKDGSIYVSKMIENENKVPASQRKREFSFKMLLTGDANRVPETLKATYISTDSIIGKTLTVEEGIVTFTLRGSEQMRFNAVPGGLAYDIWEETPDGWVLVKQENDTGTVIPNDSVYPTFTNEYLPDQEYVYLRATKKLDDSAVPQDKIFTFVLNEVSEDGALVGEVQTVDTTPGGAIIFDPIVFERGKVVLDANGEKTLYYTITEQIPTGDKLDPNIQYDTSVYHVEVKLSIQEETVTDNNGNVTQVENLVSTVTYRDDNGQPVAGDAPVFNNTTLPGHLSVHKAVTGIDPAAVGDVKFTFKAVFIKDGKPWDGVTDAYGNGKLAGVTDTNPDEGSVTFEMGADETLTFANLPAGVSYSVTETNVPAGWSMGPDPKPGTIASQQTIGITFENTYAPAGFAILKAYKELDGRTPLEDEFSFSLYEAKDENDLPPHPLETRPPIETVRNDDIDTREEIPNPDDPNGPLIKNPDFGKYTVTFQAIQYTQPGTYYYVIRENEDIDPTLVYDLEPRRVTVRVKDVGGGRLETECDYDGKGNKLPIFQNRVARGNLELSKTVTGRTNSQERFAFTITVADALGTPYGSDCNATLTGPGGTQGMVVTFDDKGQATVFLRDGETILITDLPDGVQYTVTEEEAPGYTPVPAQATGTIINGQTSKAAFENRYAAKGEYTFKATKEMVGLNLKEEQFLFTVMDEKTGQMIGAYNHADGSVIFPALHFTLDDVGRHTYAVYEVEAGERGIVYDPTMYAVTLDVQDQGNGELQVTAVDLPAEGLRFHNEFCLVEGVKLINDRMADAGAEGLYTFTLSRLNDNGTVYQPGPGETASWTTTNDENGSIRFADLELTNLVNQPGTHYFRLEESGQDTDYLTADKTVYVLALTTSEDAKGDLQMDRVWYRQKADIADWKGEQIPTPGFMPEFNNVYRAKGSLSLTASKTVGGQKPWEEDQFTFTLTGEQLNLKGETRPIDLTATSDVSGQVVFPELKYDELDIGRTYLYTVRETPGAEAYIGYDPTEYTVHVTVVDKHDGTLRLDQTIVREGKRVSELKFENQYDAVGEWRPEAVKQFDGKAPAAGQTFTFHLSGENTDEAGNRVVTDLTVQNQNDQIAFAPIAYTSTIPGSVQTYVYYLEEDEQDTDNTLADHRVFRATVTVTDQKNGQLEATVDWHVAMTPENAKADQDVLLFTDPDEVDGDPVFDNASLTSLTITKKVTGLVTDETFPFRVDLINPAHSLEAFQAEITAADSAKNRTIEFRSGETIGLAHGEQAVIRGLPVGTQYTVTEMTPVRFEATVGGQQTNVATGTLPENGAQADFENTLLSTQFQVTKKWRGQRGGHIQLTLFADETPMEPQPRWKQDGDVYTVEGLAKYAEDGHAILYSAQETYMDGYVTSYVNTGAFSEESRFVYDGGTIVNRQVMDITFNKKWECADGLIPDSFSVVVYRNGKEYKTRKFAVSETGLYTLTNLPADEGDLYYMIEVPMDGFSASYSNLGSLSDVHDRVYAGGTITNISTKVPQTGDRSHLGLTSAMLLLSGCAMLRLARKRTRKS